MKELYSHNYFSLYLPRLCLLSMMAVLPLKNGLAEQRLSTCQGVSIASSLFGDGVHTERNHRRGKRYSAPQFILEILSKDSGVPAGWLNLCNSPVCDPAGVGNFTACGGCDSDVEKVACCSEACDEATSVDECEDDCMNYEGSFNADCPPDCPD